MTESTDDSTASGRPPAAPADASADLRGEEPAVVGGIRPDQMILPPECACCGAVASRSLRAARLDGRSVLVPYCGDCQVHASRDATRVLATSVASVLVAATLAAGLPLVFQPPSAVVLALVVGLGSLAPLVLARVTGSSRRRTAGHAALGRAVLFRADGALVCFSSEFGRRLAEASGATVTNRPLGEARVSGWAKVSILGIVAMCPLSYRFLFPEARIVNLSGQTLTILVDGRARAVVNPTSLESPSAGVVVRIPAGQRELRAVAPGGRVVELTTVMVIGGGAHLYAPGSQGTCFRVETTGYGRSRGDAVPDEPLPGDLRFWPLTHEIDFWFSAAPEPASDDRSSGGQLRALRQAPCGPTPPPGSRIPPFATEAE